MAEDELQDLLARVRGLSAIEVAQVRMIVDALTTVELQISHNVDSDFVDEAFAAEFGALLRIHHAFSDESFTKDKFEHAFVRVASRSDAAAELAPRGNPGHDATVNGLRWSLKTQADRGINAEQIHISKFMELGKGKWESEEDLPGLRDRMLTHMESYDRILDLRCLSSGRSWPSGNVIHYELIEIPKTLLERAQAGSFRMAHESRQTPKPGYCDVFDDDGQLAFELYFDGGTERKLQVRKLRTDLCFTHATWRLVTPEL